MQNIVRRLDAPRAHSGRDRFREICRNGDASIAARSRRALGLGGAHGFERVENKEMSPQAQLQAQHLLPLLQHKADASV